MHTLKRFPLILLLAILPALGQDCQQKTTFTATSSSANYQITNLGCSFWVLNYTASGFSAVSVAMQSTDDTGSGPGSWADVPAATSTTNGYVYGTNPMTTTAGDGPMLARGFYGYVRVNVTATGTGTIKATLLGWKAPQAGFIAQAAPTPPAPGCTTTQGTYAALPAAGNACNSYLTTDSVYTFFDTGSTWSPYYKGYNVTRPPAAASWTAFGTPGAGSSIADGKGWVTAAVTGAGSALRGYWRNTGAAVFDHSFSIESQATTSASSDIGLIVYESVSQHAVVFGMLPGTTSIVIDGFNSLTSYSGFLAQVNNYGLFPSPPSWFRVKSTATALTFYVGWNPFQWYQIYTQNYAGGFFTVAPTQIGIGTWTNNTELRPISAYHWTL